MKKWVQNYLLFIILFLLALCQAVTGLLLWLAIPGGGYRGGRSIESADTTFLWSRNTWISLHDWTAVALLVIVIIHIILHWKWILYTTKKAFGLKNNEEGN
jgi:cytochrome b561